MASYSAVIDLRVNGLSGLKKVEDRIGTINGLLKQIKPIQTVFDKRLRADTKENTESLKKARNELADYVKAVGEGSKRGQVFSTTLAGLNSQVKAFGAIAANAAQGSDEFNNSIRASEKASIRLAEAEAQRLKVQQEFFTGKQPEGQSTAVRDILKLGNKLPKSIAGLEFYQQQLRQTQEQVLIGSNAFRALEEAIADVDQRLASSRLTGQTSKIQAAAGPATDLGSLKAFKDREKFEAQILQQRIKQFAVSQRINQANLEETQKANLRLLLSEASNELLNNDLAVSKQITTEIERQRTSLERAKRAREQGVAPRRTGVFSPLKAPERLKNIQNSAVLLQEKLNTLSAKGVDVTKAKSQVEQFILQTKNKDIQLDLKTLNLLDDELNGLRQILKLENQRLQTSKATERAKSKADGKKAAGRKRLGQAAVGAAFPALFGGGPLSILGGGLGEFIGAGAGIPLGGVVGSAIGQALEQAAIQVSEFGSALLKPTENLDALAKAAGLAGTSAAGRIKTAEFLGAPEIAGRIAKNQLTEVIGQQGIENFEQLGKESTRLAGTFEKLKSNIGAAFAPLFTGLARFTNFLLGGGSPTSTPAQRVTEIEDRISEVRQRGGRGSAAALNRLNSELEAQKRFRDERATTDQASADIVEGRLRILQQETALEENRNVLGRVSLATLQGSLEVNRATQKITELELRQKATEVGIEQKILQIQIDQAEEQKRAAEFAKRNAEELARISLKRDTASSSISQFQAEQKTLDITRKIEELTDSDANNYQRKLDALQGQARTQIAVKTAEASIVLETVKENTLRNQIEKTLQAELDVIMEQYEFDVKRVKQAEALRQATEQRRLDELKIAKLQAKLSADAQIRQTSPETIGQFLGSGFGFFDESVRLEDELFQQRMEQMEIFEARADSLRNTIEKLQNEQKVDPDAIKKEQDRLDALNTTIESYKKLQPQIDEAAVAQQRFNEAFAVTAPLVNVLTNGLQSLVEGTKTVEEVFADFLKTIGDMLVKEAARMIATYIAIGIARAFAGMAGGGGESTTTITSGATSYSTDGLAASFSGIGLATGGPTSPGTTYLVGEKGPELLTMTPGGGYVTSNSSSRAAMSRYNTSNTADSTPTFRLETTVINGVEYATVEQVREMGAISAKRGAQMGQSNTMKSLQNSRSQRSRIGMR